MIEAVGVAGVASPGEPLVVGEVARVLGLKVEKALADSIPVVERRGGNVEEENEPWNE